MSQKKHLKQSIEAIDYAIAILEWQKSNLLKKTGEVTTMGDPPTAPLYPPCKVGYREENGRCFPDIG